MKARGPLNARITRHNMMVTGAEYYAVACVGTVRCRYIDVTGEWTAKETDAMKFDRGMAQIIMKLIYTESPLLFGYCRLVKFAPGNMGEINGLPTTGGR